MFLVDDILLSPLKGLLYIFREIHKVVEQDAGSEAETIRAEMSELYMLLETGQITEAEADDREKELLDRLDALEARGQSNHDDDKEDEEEGDDEEDEDEEGDDEEDEDEEGEEDDDEIDAPDELEAAESPPTAEELAL